MKNLFSIREREFTWRVIIVLIFVFCFGIAVFAIVMAMNSIDESRKQVYVLVNNTHLVKAQATDITNTTDIRTKAAIVNLNELIFQQVPDPDQINSQLKSAIAISDKSTANLIDGYVQNGFYKSIVSQNFFTVLSTDSVSVNYALSPSPFIFYGKLKIFRQNDSSVRRIVTKGEVQNIDAASSNNDRGFLFRDLSLISDDKVIEQ